MDGGFQPAINPNSEFGKPARPGATGCGQARGGGVAAGILGCRRAGLPCPAEKTFRLPVVSRFTGNVPRFARVSGRLESGPLARQDALMPPVVDFGIIHAQKIIHKEGLFTPQNHGGPPPDSEPIISRAAYLN